MSLPQFRAFAEAEVSRLGGIQATMMEGFMAAVGGLIDKDASREVQAFIKKLRDA